MMFFANFNDGRIDKHLKQIPDAKAVADFLTEHEKDSENVNYVECVAFSREDYQRINPNGRQDCCYLYVKPGFKPYNSTANQVPVLSSSCEKAIEALKVKLKYSLDSAEGKKP